MKEVKRKIDSLAADPVGTGRDEQATKMVVLSTLVNLVNLIDHLEKLTYERENKENRL